MGTFPNLASSPHQETSKPSDDYNCVAWAIERDQRRWWQPGGAPFFWPVAAAPRSRLMVIYFECFASLGFKQCKRRLRIPGWQKIAIYTDGGGGFLHVASQLPDGKWTSKLGRGSDICHDSLEAIEGGGYGRVTYTMRRLDPTLGRVRILLARLAGAFIA